MMSFHNIIMIKLIELNINYLCTLKTMLLTVTRLKIQIRIYKLEKNSNLALC